MEIENILKVLDYHTITTNKVYAEGEQLFERNILFSIAGEHYEIEWWKNISYLYYNDITIPFISIRRTNTWPHKSKMNLQFYDPRENVCCILKIEGTKEG